MAKMGTKNDFETALQQVFSQAHNGRDKLLKSRRLSGGASQESWLLTGTDHQSVLRRRPGGQALHADSTALSLETEAALMQAALRAGLPVPSILKTLGTESGLGEGFVMQYVEGETIARKILRDERFSHARTLLTQQCGQALAIIHGLDRSQLPASLPESDGAAQLTQYEGLFRSFDVDRPVFELALGWLKARIPPTMEYSLVHGDFRLGNLMIDENGLVAVLDWELAHLGDPREDLAWICVNSWRFGNAHLRVGGFGELPDMLAAYHASGGALIRPEEIVWWEVLGTLKWGIMCMIMYQAYRTATDPSVERAAIGRRVSETEIDLLNLLEAAHA